MMIGRVVASLCHGAFFGIGSVVAADLVTKKKAASAIAMMFTGLTVANVLGVPLGTLIGQACGLALDLLGVAVLGVARPRRHREARPRLVNDRREPRADDAASRPAYA